MGVACTRCLDRYYVRDAAAERLSHDPLLGRCLSGTWVVIDRLGEGGFAYVYLGLDRVLARAVAIKVPRDVWQASVHELSDVDAHRQVVERFTREARAMAALTHPQLVSLYALGLWGVSERRQVPFLVMEALEGCPSLHKREKPLPIRELHGLFLDVLDGLAHAHARGVVHRDITPSNILVLDGRAKILDLGLARACEGAAVKLDTLTRDNTYVGTPAYAAPELALGLLSAKGTPRPEPGHDRYAVAAVLYECLTGKAPWSGTARQVVKAQARTPYAPLNRTVFRALPADLQAFLGKAMHMSPPERFASDLAMRDAWDTLCVRRRSESLSVAVLPPTPDPLPQNTETSDSTVGSYVDEDILTESSGPFVQNLAAERYEDLCGLGAGGMGEVRRVRDRMLGRVVAMKVLKAELMHRPRSVARFVEEAQVGSQLQHPGLVPVYEVGQFEDGRLFFTMREVRGRSFKSALQDNTLTLRRRITILHRACEAVGYAHSRAVVHRDLKPSNIMLGSAGEVLVVDWGLVKVISEEVGLKTEEDISLTERDDIEKTQLGSVAGTVQYMAPEQALGQLNAIDQRTDVYALGAILYELLSGAPPFTGTDAASILRKVREERPPALNNAPEDLIEICHRAMHRQPDHRYATAAEMSGALGLWLEDARAREKGLAEVARARELQSEARSKRARALALEEASRAWLAKVPKYAPEDEKHPGWDKADEANALKRDVLLDELRVEALLQGALLHAPGLREAHLMMAEHYSERHRQARGDQAKQLQAEARLRAEVEALPAPERKPFITYLKGIGSLTLITDPEGAEVRLFRYVDEHRRRIPRFERALGHTPLAHIDIKPGSYLLLLEREGHVPVKYPVYIERGGEWHGIPPGASSPCPIPLPRHGELGPLDVYVPAGYFLAGGLNSNDRYGGPTGLRPLWADGFVIERFPVTNRRYLEFLNTLIDLGREEEALLAAPREPGSRSEEIRPVYGRDAQGHFVLVPDSDGDLWDPEWPVLMVDWDAANAMIRWLNQRASPARRLLVEFEYEKATRSVDGRNFSWGNHFDPSRTCSTYSFPGRPFPAVVNAFPVDESPYGARGMTGNVETWCLNVHHDDPPQERVVIEPKLDDLASMRSLRGGSWMGNPKAHHAARRWRAPRHQTSPSLGIRLGYSYPITV